MCRKIVGGLGRLASRCCPLPHISRALADSTNKEDQKLGTRLAGFAYMYTMIWVGAQMVCFVSLFIIFLMSEKNPYMVDEDCCTADTYLTRTNNDLPFVECPMKSCLIYDFITTSSAKNLGDKRPRSPEDGDTSFIFQRESTQWCCNTAATGDECCSSLPWDWSCGMVMWMCGFAAICSMVMAQVILQGFYSFTSRRNAWFVTLSTMPAILMRLFMFELMFYVFFAFCFVFLHFWYPMTQCDNNYAMQWYLFGMEYFYHFFSQLDWVITHGFTEWDGYWDLDTFISTHASLAFAIDVVFSLLYGCLSKIKDGSHRPYLHLTFFRL